MPIEYNSEPVLFIGALSARTGAKIETIRYYERIGLLTPPRRSAGGQRLCTAEHVRELTFIRRARELGFAINDIRALLQLRKAGNEACVTAQDIALRHLREVRGRIASLRKLERTLKAMTTRCNPDVQPSCPIIDALGTDQPRDPAPHGGS